MKSTYKYLIILICLVCTSSIAVAQIPDINIEMTNDNGETIGNLKVSSYNEIKIVGSRNAKDDLFVKGEVKINTEGPTIEFICETQPIIKGISIQEFGILMSDTTSFSYETRKLKYYETSTSGKTDWYYYLAYTDDPYYIGFYNNGYFKVSNSYYYRPYVIFKDYLGKTYYGYGKIEKIPEIPVDSEASESRIRSVDKTRPMKEINLSEQK